MSYQHRISVKEIETSIAIPVSGTSGLQVVIGTAPVNMAEDPYNTIYKPFLINQFSDAASQLGYSEDHKNYTLCASMDASFRIFNVAPIILINVLDPRKHKKSNEEKTYAVTDKQATIDIEGILPDTLVVKNDTTALKLGTDYIYSFDNNGYVIITLLESGAGKEAKSLKVSSTSIDPAAVTETDVIGGLDSATGKETGCELIRQVYPLYQMTPGLLLAPGWSHKPRVGAVLAAKSKEINGVFRCENVLDLDTGDTGAKKYTDCAAAKVKAGYSSETSILCWPKVLIAGKQYYYSAIWAAMAAYTDASHNDLPYKSPSNELLNVGGAVLEDGTELNLDTTQAELLNGVGIVTLINDTGWKSYGNNTAAYPNVTDPKDRWICCRRMFSWYGNRFILSYKSKVDDPTNYRLIENLVDAENGYLNSLTPDYIAGGEIAFNEKENPITSILNGAIKFHTKVAFYTPAEYIENDLEFDPTILQAAITGGQ